MQVEVFSCPLKIDLKSLFENVICRDEMFGTGSECLVVAVNLYNQCFTFYLCKSKSNSYKNYFQPDKNKSGFPNKVTQVKRPTTFQKYFK